MKIIFFYIRLLYQQLDLIHKTGDLENHQEIIKEVLQMVENYLLYGDKHDSNIFE